MQLNARLIDFEASNPLEFGRLVFTESEDVLYWCICLVPEALSSRWGQVHPLSTDFEYSITLVLT